MKGELASLKGMTYTFFGTCVDKSGSVGRFVNELRQGVITCMETCADSPCSEDVLSRVTMFSDMYQPQGVRMLHDWTLAAEVSENHYPQSEFSQPDGSTPACMAALEMLDSMEISAKAMQAIVNGILTIITDGAATDLEYLPMLQQKISSIAGPERPLETLIILVIGVGEQAGPESFARSLGQGAFYVPCGTSKEAMMKMARMVSASVMSQSKSTGTGEAGQIAPFNPGDATI